MAIETGRLLIQRIAWASDQGKHGDDVNPSMAKVYASEVARKVTLGISADMLREGIQLVPVDHEHGGVRVELVGEDVEVDLSERTVADLLLAQLLPRYRAITEGVE